MMRSDFILMIGPSSKDTTAGNELIKIAKTKFGIFRLFKPTRESHHRAIPHGPCKVPPKQPQKEDDYSSCGVGDGADLPNSLARFRGIATAGGGILHVSRFRDGHGARSGHCFVVLR